VSTFFNAFQSQAAPQLMTMFGTPGSVTITSGATVVVQDADAVLRPIKGVDDIDQQGNEVKKLTREVWLYVDSDLSSGGLSDDYTGARADVEGLAWEVEQIKSKTDTYHALTLARTIPRGRHRTGLYVDQ